MSRTDRKKSILKLLTEESLNKNINNFNNIVKTLQNYSKVIIYGAGGWGVSLKKLLETHSIKISAFFDQKAEEIGSVDNIPVYSPDQYKTSENHNETLVIIAVRLEHHEIISNNLRKLGFLNCTTINSIWHYACWVEYRELLSLLDEKNEILQCLELWEDPKSLELFYRQLECYASRVYNVSNKIDNNQYFPDDIKFKKGYLNFIDCGAYTGDTVLSLTKNIGKIDNLVAIEPDTENFKELHNCINANKTNIANNIYLYPNGIFSCTKMLSFNNKQGTASSISELGDSYIQTVSLDDILVGFIPSFIKMDVEGAELEGLKGAQNILQKHKPHLAISVYHEIAHLWKVPLLLKKIHNNYKFYLRSYEHFNQETVLYAI